MYCSTLREDIGNMAIEETTVAEALPGKLKVVRVRNYSSLPDQLTGKFHNGILPCPSEE